MSVVWLKTLMMMVMVLRADVACVLCTSNNNKQWRRRKKYTQFHSEPVQFSFIGNPPQIITTYYIPPASSLSLARLSYMLTLRLLYKKERRYVCYEIVFYTYYTHLLLLLRRENDTHFYTMLQKSCSHEMLLFIFIEYVLIWKVS